MSAYLKIIFLLLTQNICCRYSKEPSQWNGSFEHLKQMFKLMDKIKLKTFVYLDPYVK